VVRRDDANNRDARDDDDFVAAIGRGFDVIKAFGPDNPVMTGSEISARTGISRPTVRRILMTLEQLGYATKTGDGYTLTVRTLELGAACISALDEWELARPHMVQLVAKTGESSSMAQLEGSDIVYRERVSVPKIVALRVKIGSRFPATATSIGRVLLAELNPDELEAVLATPSRSRVIPRIVPTPEELTEALQLIREHGWCISDQLLSFGVRSIAAPVRDASGKVTAAINLTAHAAETSIDSLVKKHLPLLLHAAEAVTEEWSKLSLLPYTELPLDGPLD
jgi:IclR family pca regulon transcriptional regulator